MSLDFPGYGSVAVARPVPVRRFDPEGGAWAERIEDASDVRVSSLKLVTFNTWFQGPEPAARHAALLQVLHEADADVVMLQEATMPLADAIMAQPWIRNRHFLARAPFRADAIPSHGVLLLSRFPLRSAMLHPLKTYMGRSLLIGEALVNGTPVTLATAHLDSMKGYEDVRKAQLATIFALLEPARTVLLAGDFNFSASSPENQALDARYVDVWPALRPAEPGYTQDTAANPMLAAAKGREKRVRIDRILVRSDDAAARWVPQTVELLGTQPAGPPRAAVHPSDHFGVAAVFRSD